MGAINLDNTGSGGAITLSSDGTSLLLGGSAVGGGGADLYAANESSPNAQPSALGNNAIAIGNTTIAGTQASHQNAIAIGGSNNTSQPIQATNLFAVAIGAAYYGGVTASSDGSMAIGTGATVASASGALALGRSSTAAGNAAVSLPVSYASGANSLAAAINNSSSSYGSTATSSIAIGYRAKASGAYSVAISGHTNVASGSQATSIGGENNTASGAKAVALGGSTNYATAEASYAFGNRASAKEIGKYSYGGYFGFSGTFSGGFGVGGSQGGMMVLGAATTDATPTVLRTNTSAAGSTNQLVAFTDTAITFEGSVTGIQNGAQAFASFLISGLLVNDGGTTTLVNSATTVIDNQSSWTVAMSADNTNNALAITVTGEASHNIRWVANIRTSEVTYA